MVTTDGVWLDPTKKNPVRNSAFEKRMALYALAGGAVLAIPSSAIAAPCVPFMTYSSLGTNSCELDVDSSGTPEFGLLAMFENGVSAVRIGDEFGINLIQSTHVQYDDTKPDDPDKGALYRDYANLLSPSTVLSGGDWRKDAYLLRLEGADLQGQWVNDINVPGYIGLTFDQGLGPFGYGWVQVGAQVSPQSSSFRIYNWGASDHVGSNPEIPEPSTISLMALGAAGLLALRRRRKLSEKTPG